MLQLANGKPFRLDKEFTYGFEDWAIGVCVLYRDVSFFFVKKNDGRLRTICDARHVNERFLIPPSVDLVTAEGLARIVIPRPPDLDAAGLAEWEKQLEV